MVLDLTAQEQAYLVELLNATQKEMIHELSHTDTREYREILKRRLAILEGLQAKLPASGSVASS